MITNTDQPQQEKNEAFGLPQVEFKPIAARGRQWFKVTAIIVGIVLTVGAGVVYWFFYHPSTKDSAKDIIATAAEHVTGALTSEEDTMHHNTPSKYQATEQDAKTPQLIQELKASEGEANVKEFNASRPDRLRKGTMASINTAQGYYYIVLGSFIDEDLALDYAHRLMQKGVEIALISPPTGQYYFRVAIKQGKTFREANEEAKALKTVYGPNIWVMKY